MTKDDCWFCGSSIEQDDMFIDVTVRRMSDTNKKEYVLHRLCTTCADKNDMTRISDENKELMSDEKNWLE